MTRIFPCGKQLPTKNYQQLLSAGQIFNEPCAKIITFKLLICQVSLKDYILLDKIAESMDPGLRRGDGNIDGETMFIAVVFCYNLLI
jgi:hypothetical protein